MRTLHIVEVKTSFQKNNLLSCMYIMNQIFKKPFKVQNTLLHLYSRFILIMLSSLNLLKIVHLLLMVIFVSYYILYIRQVKIHVVIYYVKNSVNVIFNFL